jgi:hypothetical protein
VNLQEVFVMVDKLKKFSSTPFLLCLFLFFLPFVDVSCQGQKISSLTGIQLAAGATIQQAQPFGRPKAQRIDAEPLATLTLLCVVAGGLIAFLGSKANAIIPALLSGAGASMLLLLKAKLDNDALAHGQGLLQVEYEPAYWLCFLVLLIACGLNAYIFSNREAPSTPG